MPSLRAIPQSELTDNLEEILRQAEKGASFLITVDGSLVAHLTPYQGKHWVPKTEFLRLLQTCKPDPRLFEDISE